jgi:hypothetical protein
VDFAVVVVIVAVVSFVSVVVDAVKGVNVSGFVSTGSKTAQGEKICFQILEFEFHGLGESLYVPGLRVGGGNQGDAYVRW